MCTYQASYEKICLNKAAVVKLIDYGVHHPESSHGGGIKNKNK